MAPYKKKEKKMNDEALKEKIKDCSFVLNGAGCAVAVKDVPEGFVLVAKGEAEEARRIVEQAEKEFKLVVETEDARTIFEKIETDVVFNDYDEFLIDVEEEFRLIKTGSKKAKGKA